VTSIIQNRLVDEREILIVGLGSVGRRHLNNLQTLAWNRIRIFRTGRSTLPDVDHNAYPVEHDLTTALERRPLAVIVANPSALHLPVALAAARAGAHLLIEKPISHDLEGVSALEGVVSSRGLTALVGFQFRFNPGLQQIKRWIDDGAIGRVVSAQVHYGEYLPGMHPWEDYHLGYAARSELGGGVLLTFCHAFDYLRWLIADVDYVSAFEPRRRPLDVHVDTCVDVTLGFTSGASAHVHLDFVQQPHTHRLTIVGTGGTITWSHEDHAARLYCGVSRQWHTVPAPDGFERNWMFLDEMRHFLACLRGEEQPRVTIHDGVETVKVVMKAKSAIVETAPCAEAT